MVNPTNPFLRIPKQQRLLGDTAPQFGGLQREMKNLNQQVANNALVPGTLIGQALPWIIAGGAPDAITAAYNPSILPLVDGQLAFFRASAVSATTTPTFSPDGDTPRVIVKNGGKPLVAGDIPGALAETILRYNLANTRWELMNPASAASTVPWCVATASGSPTAYVGTYSPAIVALTDGLLLSFRAPIADSGVGSTFQANATTAHVITKAGGEPLNFGDIPNTNAECFIRYNLANTRWELLNPYVVTDFISIREFPTIDLTGAVDATATFQAVVNALSNGQVLTIPGGSTIKISSTINLGNGSTVSLSTINYIKIMGMGVPSADTLLGFGGGTNVRFIWAGGAGTFMFNVAGPIQGWGLENFTLDGAGVADGGLVVTAGMFGQCRGLAVINCKTTMSLQCLGTWPTGEANCLHNLFENLYLQTTNVANANGLALTGVNSGGSQSNSSYNTFINTTISIPNGVPAVGVYFGWSDSNCFFGLHIIGGGFGGAGIVFDYTTFNNGPTGMIFHSVDTGICTTQFFNIGFPGQFARANYVTAVNEANGAYVPQLQNLVCTAYSSQSPPWNGFETGIFPNIYEVNLPQTWNFIAGGFGIQDGMIIGFRVAPGRSNTGVNPVLKILDNGAASGYAVAAITRPGGVPSFPGDLADNQAVTVRWNQGTSSWELMNPAQDLLRSNGTTSGGNNYTATYSPPIVSYYDGLTVTFRPSSPNFAGGGCTFDAGLGAAAVVRAGGSGLASSLAHYDIGGPSSTATGTASAIMKFNAGGVFWELLNPQAPNPIATLVADLPFNGSDGMMWTVADALSVSFTWYDFLTGGSGIYGSFLTHVFYFNGGAFWRLG